MALKILEGFDFDHRDSQQTWHRQLEAMKLAYSDGLHYITDPQHMKVAVQDLLSDDYARRRREQIGEQAQSPRPGDPQCPTAGLPCRTVGRSSASTLSTPTVSRRVKRPFTPSFPGSSPGVGKRLGRLG